jgi:CHASE2 domain-containing sensor protein
MQRREVFAVWVLLSAPVVGFVLYLLLALGFQARSDQFPIIAALLAALVSLFFLSWTLLSHTEMDWRRCARFVAGAFVFEGIALTLTRPTTGNGSLYFGIGTILAGLILFISSKKH